ncbi:hypothetical protein [Pantoea piersonii]|jgi:hypothetical protein|uniref:hypothetical protein n=1 Tax=Pantoea piersonii TaxID=2364647 RepID=UPI000EA1B32E|nr:hypothetical protein [Pantoea piersonii]MBZ6385127.1 hypothetical protein [Pantoea piersonii]MBZ6385203.1 hypothetical protein [Pantoea piersonii]MBZ6398655.1 hypothetical protein [Pantoea piersonii]MBZ6398731.1 hypothetical protein [Pantoea piersonii]MBZ6406585.1 hypothetical protein [Pantoea piersonii]
MRIERDFQQLVRLSGVRSAAEMRRLFGNGWKTINRSQQAWVRHLLTVWGDHLGGEDYDRGEVNVIGRLMMRCEWSEQKGKQIEKIVSQLHCEGLRGEELFRKARDLLMPQTSTANIIALAKESDDAAFVESVLVKTFGKDNPLRNVARLRYCKRKSAQNIGSCLIYYTSITPKEARNRLEWAMDIIEGEMYYAIKREMEKEIPNIAA